MKNNNLKKNQGGGIVIKQLVRFGKPCVRGTRIAIADILNLIRSGYAINEIPKQYPDITAQDVEMALRYAAKSLAKEEILEIASVGQSR
ncbi:DUF433 domain-containing protein [Patescibacteria group bacterium]|nr:DUF433 domain-containing protein [Patescibacteria group bacterium]